MGDSDISDSTSSIEIEPDNIKRDPTFKCNIKVVTPSIIRKSKRLIKRIVDGSPKSLSTVGSSTQQTTNISKVKNKSLPPQKLKRVIQKNVSSLLYKQW